MQYQIFQSPELYIFDIMFNFPREEHSLIYNEKKNIEQKYGIQPRSSSVPHITLCSFLVLSDRNERIIANLKEKLRKMKAIKVSLNGYDVFSNNVVYAKLEPKKSFNPYFKMLKSFRFENYYRERSFKISENPHATLARIDNNYLFQSIAKDYLSKELNSTFILDNLVIRRRSTNSTEHKYENIRLAKD